MNHLQIKLEMCQYDTDAPAQGHSQPHAGILQKMKLKKGTNQSFFNKKYRKENIFWRWKRAITPIIMDWFYPTWNLTSILWL